MTTHKDMPPKVDPEEEKDLELLRSNEAKNEARLQEMVTLGAPEEEIAEMRGEIDAVKLTTPEADNRTTEKLREDLSKTREAYSKELNGALNRMRKQISIDRVSTKTFNILAGVKNLLSKHKMDKGEGKNPEEYKEEDFYNDEYRRLREEYTKAQTELGNKLMEEKTAELGAAGFTGDKLKEALGRYKTTDVFNEVVIDERQRIIDNKAELANKNIFKKAWAAYKDMPRWKKVALSTTLFLPLSASTGLGAIVAAKYGIGALISLKFGTSMGTGYLTTVASSRLLNLGFNKYNKKFEEGQRTGKESAIDRYVRGEITDEDYDSERKTLAKESKKHFRNQMIIKMVTSVGLGMFIGAKTYGAIGHSLDPHGGSIGHSLVGRSGEGFHKPSLNDSTIIKQPVVNQDSIKAPITDTTNHPKITTTPDAQNQNPDMTNQDAPEAKPDIARYEVAKGEGPIKAIHHLQKELALKYPEGSTDVPPSVQHILNTKPDRLAIEYGMFKPGQDAESAIMKLGSEFKVDADGNVSFHQAGTTETTLLEKGTDAHVSEVYAGKMIDGDHSGRAHLASQHQPAGTNDNDLLNNQKPPAGAIDEQTVPKGVPSDLINNQKAPAGAIDDLASKQVSPTGAQANPLDNNNKPSTNLTQSRSENISPTKGVFDNSNGTNTQSISPTRGIYNTGEASTLGTVGVGPGNNLAEGNGFTKEVPMTNQEAAEFYGNAGNPGTGNVVENASVKDADISIENDPRHLVHNAGDVRRTFGGDAVKIDRPDTDKINGMKYDDWNKGVDDMFKERGSRFDNYDQYEKEKELQTLLGTGEKKVVFDQALNKNVEKIDMKYFRADPNWESIESKIPAKYYLEKFENVTRIDGTPLPQADFDKLVAAGVIKEKITDTDGVITNEGYIFKNQAELERLQKMYARVTPKAEQILHNDKPIDNEPLEGYMARLTDDKVYVTNKGVVYGLSKGSVADNTVVRAVNNPVRPISSGNIYQPTGGNSSVVAPAYGVYPTSSGYERRIVDRVLDRVIKPSFTRPVRFTN